jgi:hypothetical protein
MRTTLAAVAAIKVIRILKVQTEKKVSEFAYCIYISISLYLRISLEPRFAASSHRPSYCRVE